MTNPRKRAPPSCADNLSAYFSQYCDNTSIHGMKYLGERGRSAIEKLIWVVIITAVSYFCIFLIAKAYNKWVTQPVIVTFATQETPIWKIPFPAVTICPEVKSDPEVFNYTKFLLGKDLTSNPEEFHLFQSINLVCPTLNELQVFANATNMKIMEPPFDSLKMIFPDHRKDNISEAYWIEKEIPMDRLSTIYTSEGVCYTFNMFDFEDILRDEGDSPTDVPLNISAITDTLWSLLEGYSDEDLFDVYPRRTFLSGIDGGFSITLYTNHSHLDYLCGQFLQGFKVTIHHPMEWPDMDRHIMLPLDQVLNIGVKPRMLTVGEEIKSYNPEDRKCYFPNERQLKFFKNYTQGNCLFECLSNYTARSCDCLPFYLSAYFNDTSTCGPASYSCINKSKVRYFLNQDDETDEDRFSCDCLPSCTSLEYDVETSQNMFAWHQTFEALQHIGINVNLVSERNHLSRLVVYFKEMQFLSSERHELYGYVDFFSSTGGLLGLFIGISVTSGIEILYYLTLRLGCNIKKFGRSYWSGDPDLIASSTDN